MPQPMSVTFLGTSSGGGPIESRNCSSLVFDGLGNGDLWMVDCAEGTTRQFALQPERGPARLKPSKITKVFITHMHADHIMGVITLLRNALRPPWVTAEPAEGSEDGDGIPAVPQAKVQIYGPAGLRSFIRACLRATHTRTGDKYVVHELLTADDPTTSCDLEDLHSSELVGQDIVCGEDGFWRNIASGAGATNEVVVDAGPIIHRDPCIGYILHEPLPPHRKLVLLGDTYDPSALAPLITSLPGEITSLLVHEATDAYIPPSVDPQSRRTPATVQEKCVERGHSTPSMAGIFAKAINAERLVLNHIGSRFPAPPPYAGGYGNKVRANVLREIARQASEAWGAGRLAVAATDFYRVDVLAPREEVDEPDLGMPIAPRAEAPFAGAGRGGFRGHGEFRGRGGFRGHGEFRGHGGRGGRGGGTGNPRRGHSTQSGSGPNADGEGAGGRGPGGRGKRPRLDGRGRGRGDPQS